MHRSKIHNAQLIYERVLMAKIVMRSQDLMLEGGGGDACRERYCCSSLDIVHMGVLSDFQTTDRFMKGTGVTM